MWTLFESGSVAILSLVLGFTSPFLLLCFSLSVDLICSRLNFDRDLR